MNTARVIKLSQSYSDCSFKASPCILMIEKGKAVDIVWEEFVSPILKLSTRKDKLQVILSLLKDKKYAVPLLEWAASDFPQFKYHFMGVDPCLTCTAADKTLNSACCPRTEAIDHYLDSGDPDLYTSSGAGGYDGSERFVHSNGRLFQRELRIRGIEELDKKIVAETKAKEGNFDIHDYYKELVNTVSNRSLKSSLSTILEGRICPTCFGFNLTPKNYCLNCLKFVVPLESEGGSNELLMTFFNDRDPITLDDSPSHDFQLFSQCHNLPESRLSQLLYGECEDDNEMFWADGDDVFSNEREEVESDGSAK